jgi:hypothetical protein
MDNNSININKTNKCLFVCFVDIDGIVDHHCLFVCFVDIDGIVDHHFLFVCFVDIDGTNK